MALVQNGVQELAMRLSRASTKIASKAEVLAKQGAQEQANTLFKVADQMGGDYRRFYATGGHELGLVDDLMRGKLTAEQTQRTVKMAMDTADFRQAIKAANKAGGAGWNADSTSGMNNFSAHMLGMSISGVPEAQQLALFRKTVAAAPDNASRTALAGTAVDMVFYGRDEIGPAPSRVRVEAFHTEARKLLSQVFTSPTTNQEFKSALHQLQEMPAHPEVVPVLKLAQTAAGTDAIRLDALNSTANEIGKGLGFMHPIARRDVRNIAIATAGA
jgi:hypothetical protein